MSIKSVHLPTGVELINMIMSIEIRELKKKEEATITVPTLLTQANNVVNEDYYFISRDNNG